MGLMQALYWFAFICLLLFSWSRSRGILHPHFMFCAMLFILASDFMIRGQDDQNLRGIMEGNLTRYQLVTLVTMIAIGISTAIVRKPYELGTQITRPEMRVSANTALVVVLASLFVFLVHTSFRLQSVDWSVQGLLDQMLGPRMIQMRPKRMQDSPDKAKSEESEAAAWEGLKGESFPARSLPAPRSAVISIAAANDHTSMSGILALMIGASAGCGIVTLSCDSASTVGRATTMA